MNLKKVCILSIPLKNMFGKKQHINIYVNYNFNNFQKNYVKNNRWKVMSVALHMDKLNLAVSTAVHTFHISMHGRIEVL